MFDFEKEEQGFENDEAKRKISSKEWDYICLGLMDRKVYYSKRIKEARQKRTDQAEIKAFYEEPREDVSNLLKKIRVASTLEETRESVKFFFEMKVDVKKEGTVESFTLYKLYQKFCERRGIFPKNEHQFRKELKQISGARLGAWKNEYGILVRGLRGVEIRDL